MSQSKEEELSHTQQLRNIMNGDPLRATDQSLGIRYALSEDLSAANQLSSYVDESQVIERSEVDYQPLKKTKVGGKRAARATVSSEQDLVMKKKDGCQQGKTEKLVKQNYSIIIENKNEEMSSKYESQTPGDVSGFIEKKSSMDKNKEAVEAQALEANEQAADPEKQKAKAEQLTKEEKNKQLPSKQQNYAVPSQTLTASIQDQPPDINESAYPIVYMSESAASELPSMKLVSHVEVFSKPIQISLPKPPPKQKVEDISLTMMEVQTIVKQQCHEIQIRPVLLEVKKPANAQKCGDPKSAAKAKDIEKTQEKLQKDEKVETKVIEQPPEDYSRFEAELGIKKNEQSFMGSRYLEVPVEEVSRSKVMTGVLLDKISQLQAKVRLLEEQKKSIQDSKIGNENYRSSLVASPTPSQTNIYGVIKRNHSSVKKFSSISQTIETNNYNSNNFRVKSLSHRPTNKLQSNLFNVIIVDEKKTANLTEEINYLKRRLLQVQENNHIRDASIRKSIHDSSEQIHSGRIEDVPHQNSIRGKIVRRGDNIINISDTMREGVDNKQFIRNEPKSVGNRFFEQQSQGSQIFKKTESAEKKRAGSSAVFRKNPGPAVIEKTSSNHHHNFASSSLSNFPHTLEFNPDIEKFEVLESHETESQRGMSSLKLKDVSPINRRFERSQRLQINISLPEPAPTLQHSSQELVEIGKIAFKSLNCDITDQTVLNVKKYKNCVHFFIGIEHNILWNYEGKFYFGGWKTFSNGEGEKSGEGIQIVPGKYRYKGYFIEGKKNGQGLMIMDNGTIYEGQWEDGLRHGTGRQEDAEGFIYEGEWKEGKRSGYGKIYNKDQLQFEGVFSKGMKNGYGKQLFQNGDSYQGNYANNKFEGKGHYFWSSGADYDGQFQEGRRNGEGIWRSGGENEDIYEGQYLNDKKSGFGKYRWANGTVYEGQFKNDNKHGEGKLLYPNGKISFFVWEKGEVIKKLAGSPKQEQQSYNKKLNQGPRARISTKAQVTPSKNNIASRSTHNLQSAKSTSTAGGLPKGINTRTMSSKKLPAKKNELIRIKMFEEHQTPASELAAPHFSKTLKSKSQNKLQGRGAPHESEYRGMQASSSINMNL